MWVYTSYTHTHPKNKLVGKWIVNAKQGSIIIKNLNSPSRITIDCNTNLYYSEGNINFVDYKKC